MITENLPTLADLERISHKPKRITTAGHVFGARLFTFARTRILGIGVGTSSDARVIDFCMTHSNGTDGKFNTWYFNSGDHDGDNQDAKALFHWFPVKHNPIYYWSRKPFEPICEQLDEMVACAEKYSYLAFGCDGNKHRGPTVFAMFLCLAGYNPEIATYIANKFFGCNFVMPWVRQRIARLGWEYGNKFPELRARAAKLLEVAP